MNEPRHIAPAATAPYAAVAAFEHDVDVWDLAGLRLLSSFRSVLDFGGRRLALTPDGGHCLAASHGEGCLACYSCATGEMVWQRRDVRRVQTLRPAIGDDVLFCFFDEGPARVLRLSDGATIGRLRGIRDIHQSARSGVDLVEETTRLQLRSRSGERLGGISRTTFGLLASCFSPQHLGISESTGPVRFFELPGAECVWQYTPTLGRHVLELTYCEPADSFFAIEWPYRRGGAKVLLRLDPSRKLVDHVAILGSPAEAVFCNEGHHLLTSLGQLATLHPFRTRELPGFGGAGSTPDSSFEPTPPR